MTKELKSRGYPAKRHIFRYCEAELFDYHISKARLTELQAGIVHGTSVVESGPVSHATGDSVQSRALQLVSDRELTRLVRITGAIEQVYAQLPKDHRELIRLRYWRGRPIDWRPSPFETGGGEQLSRLGLARALNVSPATYDRRRGEIIELLAYRLGA